MPRGLVAMARSGSHCPLRVSGGILCSERGQSRDAFQAIPLEETSPRCNKYTWYSVIGLTVTVQPHQFSSNYIFGTVHLPGGAGSGDPREDLSRLLRFHMP